MDDPIPSPTVAVIGLGPLGLVTLKNLLEEGFDAWGYDKNAYVGGLWKYVDGPQTSILPTTTANSTKENACFTDYPYPEELPSFLKGREIERYLVAFATHFSLFEKSHLGTNVLAVRRDNKLQKWEVETSDSSGGTAKQLYDKVIVANGAENIPCYPDIPGLDSFKGDLIHSIRYKKYGDAKDIFSEDPLPVGSSLTMHTLTLRDSPGDFDGKRVLVVGLADTAAETATTLVGRASKVYLSHRRGSLMVPRLFKGKPVEHKANYRIVAIFWSIQRNFPSIAEKILTAGFTILQNQVFTIKPEWKFGSAPPIPQSVPIMSDSLVDELHAGRIRSVEGLKRVIDDRTIELADGTCLEVDSIIFCTGYKSDFSILADADPKVNPPSGREETANLRGKPLLRLYRNVFSVDYPDSLAIMGAIISLSSTFLVHDLASMAVAQVWKGNSTLPDVKDMERHIAQHHKWVCSLAARGPVNPNIVNSGDWMRWVNDVAGTGLNEKLTYGLSGWFFWCRNYSLCKKLMRSLHSPHMYRLFDTGKRKAWPGAEEAIGKVNGA